MARPPVTTVAAVLSSITWVKTAAGNLQEAVTASASDQSPALARGRPAGDLWQERRRRPLLDR
jgi:hypothetical protein